MNLYCEACENKIGERKVMDGGVTVDTIHICVRGRHRRAYVVSCIEKVTCDFCGHTGKPFPTAMSHYELKLWRQTQKSAAGCAR